MVKTYFDLISQRWDTDVGESGAVKQVKADEIQLRFFDVLIGGRGISTGVRAL